MEGSEHQGGRLLSPTRGLPYQDPITSLSQSMVNNPLQLVGMSSVAGGGPPNFLGGLAPPPSGQQPLVIPVSTNPSQGFRKVLVKPIAPKQTLPAGIASMNLMTGLVPTATNTASSLQGQIPFHGTLPEMSQHQSILSSVQPPLLSAPPNQPIPNFGQLQPLSPPQTYVSHTHSANMLLGSDQDKKATSPVAPPPHSSLVNRTPKRRTSSQSSSSGVPTGVPTSKPRKPCNCKNSQCLKLYCDCFANGEFCRDSCNCQNCKNSLQYEEDRARAVKACLERNPNAFKPKVGHVKIGDERRHIKGCNCKKSSCLKNYCECYEAKIPCSHLCRCVGCQNLPDRPEGKGLMQLANAADLRTQQQKAASSHFLEQLETFTPHFVHNTQEGQRLPYSFVNKDVTKATALCLLEEASHSSSSGKSPADVERSVLIEFGRCLEQIISSAESANQAQREPVSGKV